MASLPTNQREGNTMEYLDSLFDILRLDAAKLNGLYQLKETDIICPMCEGSHGNNTNCQRND